jgi:hypothetical protein
MEFIITKPALQKILKGILHTKEECKQTRKVQERINSTKQVDEQIRIRKEANITKTIILTLQWSQLQ